MFLETDSGDAYGAKLDACKNAPELYCLLRKICSTYLERLIPQRDHLPLCLWSQHQVNLMR